jgi:hypothetical protein
MWNAIKPTASQARRVFLAILCCACATAVGCEGGSKPGTARLQGKITIDGQPPPPGALGTISFRATGPGQASSTSAEIIDGEYDCPDVPQGDVTVFIQLVQPTGKTIDEGGRQYPELRNLVPSKYDLGINLEISGSNPNQNFELATNDSANNS